MNDDKKKTKISKSPAERALLEAKNRNSAKKRNNKLLEIGGREGPEPTRFGDWEKNGIISDF